MLFVKSFHIIALVAWFAGLFYLPRLFVYHADTKDTISVERFKVMERRLYYGITWPAAVATTLFGIWLICYNPAYYLKAPWMHAKLSLVLLVWVYHLSCGHYLKLFSSDKNVKSTRFFRFFNEMPTLLLVGIVLLVVVKPF
ncbi:protoporphyrinogen oxidase HemJ [Legionella maioricensis]|uniref:Protoporphyrinogen IX oxidase n=1 Tax=Legionella maioricensis TaxID=2896528 RepID=A0A9X2IDQ2_9GAMM|nr:protoporphyrinogen oxidase HemJ [Legionella maioricensis]MCL9685013.1 protoporphyrinogen oxidase HemJ [Legionella maioricensis]MCL9688090.1 protoporphyrinogen oxidase HemJ [Legionella maioricensis]